jgi:TetR/AcrR family transcriptional repressor of nem operon
MPALRAYLAALAAALRADPELAARGCLMVNTMTELGSHDPDARALALAYHRRITAAFANTLGVDRPGADGGVRAERAARTLFAAVIGVMVTARLDPAAAAELCELLSDELVGPT